MAKNEDRQRHWQTGRQAGQAGLCRPGPGSTKPDRCRWARPWTRTAHTVHPWRPNTQYRPRIGHTSTSESMVNAHTHHALTSPSPPPPGIERLQRAAGCSLGPLTQHAAHSAALPLLLEQPSARPTAAPKEPPHPTGWRPMQALARVAWLRCCGGCMGCKPWQHPHTFFDLLTHARIEWHPHPLTTPRNPWVPPSWLPGLHGLPHLYSVTRGRWPAPCSILAPHPFLPGQMPGRARVLSAMARQIKMRARMIDWHTSRRHSKLIQAGDRPLFCRSPRECSTPRCHPVPPAVPRTAHLLTLPLQPVISGCPTAACCVAVHNNHGCTVLKSTWAASFLLSPLRSLQD